MSGGDDKARTRLAGGVGAGLAVAVVVAFYATWDPRLQPLLLQGPRLLIFAALLLTVWLPARWLRRKLALEALDPFQHPPEARPSGGEEDATGLGDIGNATSGVGVVATMIGMCVDQRPTK